MAFLLEQELIQKAQDISALTWELWVRRIPCLGTKEGRWLWATRSLKSYCAPPVIWAPPLMFSICRAFHLLIHPWPLSPRALSTVFPGQGSRVYHGATSWQAVALCSYAIQGICLPSGWSRLQELVKGAADSIIFLGDQACGGWR